MPNETIVVEASAPQEKRLRKTEQHLRAALERLVTMKPNHPSLRGGTYRLTVAALAREARVSRNTIYAHHRSIIEELDRAAQRDSTSDRPDHDQMTSKLRQQIEQLQRQRQSLATENAVLLKRAMDAEQLVDRLQKQNAKLVRELAAARRPAPL